MLKLQIPFKSLMSHSIIHGVPINWLYSYHVTNNVWTTTKYTTLIRLWSLIVSRLRIMTYITIYNTLHSSLCNILKADQSSTNIYTIYKDSTWIWAVFFLFNFTLHSMYFIYYFILFIILHKLLIKKIIKSH